MIKDPIYDLVLGPPHVYLGMPSSHSLIRASANTNARAGDETGEIILPLTSSSRDVESPCREMAHSLSCVDVFEENHVSPNLAAAQRRVDNNLASYFNTRQNRPSKILPGRFSTRPNSTINPNSTSTWRRNDYRPGKQIDTRGSQHFPLGTYLMGR